MLCLVYPLSLLDLPGRGVSCGGGEDGKSVKTRIRKRGFTKSPDPVRGGKCNNPKKEKVRVQAIVYEKMGGHDQEG